MYTPHTGWCSRRSAKAQRPHRESRDEAHGIYAVAPSYIINDESESTEESSGPGEKNNK